jgi:hypothetical protein
MIYNTTFKELFEQVGINRLVDEEISYDVDHLLDEFEILISQLNAEQLNAFNEIVHSVLNT